MKPSAVVHRPGPRPKLPRPGTALAIDDYRRRGMLELDPATHLPHDLQHALIPRSKITEGTKTHHKFVPPSKNSSTGAAHQEPHLHRPFDGTGAE